MRCLYCRKQIGTFRRVVDREFCSSEHRRRFHTSSARALRDAGELLSDYDDYLAVVEQPRKAAAAKPGARFSMVTAAMVGLVLGLSLWIVPSGPMPVPGSQLRYSLASNPFSQRIRSFIPETNKINLKHDFRMGLGEWLGSSRENEVAGVLHTSGLRLWKPTLRLTDYQLEFQASIERRAVGWAFRAHDMENYYGAKLSLGGRDGTRSEIERFVVLAGREASRVRLPIPVSIHPDTLYRVRMRVKGDQFVTSLDGQVIDSWRDRRLRTGGVGFLAERGEQASVRWVSLSEPDSFLSRIFAGLLIPPGAMPGIGQMAMNAPVGFITVTPLPNGE